MESQGVELRVVGGEQDGLSLSIGPSRLRVVIGRGEGVDLRITGDQSLSRRHAEVEWLDGSVLVRNLSTQGLSINGRPTKGTLVIKAGGQFVCGATSFLVAELVAEAGTIDLRRSALLETGSSEPRHKQGSGRESRAPEPSLPRPAARAGSARQSGQSSRSYEPSEDAGFDAQGVFHMGDTAIAMSRPRAAEDPPRLNLVAVLIGLAVIAWPLAGWFVLGPMLQSNPGLLLRGLALAALSAAPFLLLFKALDASGRVLWRHYLTAAVWGASVGAGFALILNTAAGEALESAIGVRSGGVTVILVAPLVEELLKALGVVALFYAFPRRFDDALEGLVLGAASGLGFAMTENAFYHAQLALAGEGALAWTSYRAVVSGLFGHPLYTAMLGAGLGFRRELPEGHSARPFAPFLGLVLALGLHMFWNGAMVIVGSMAGKDLGALLLVTAVVGGSGLLFFGCVLLVVLRRERGILIQWLASEREAGFVTDAEFESLRPIFGRIFDQLAGLARGLGEYRLRRRLGRAQVELAYRKRALARGAVQEGEEIDAQLLALREDIRDLRNALSEGPGVGAP